jgi:orotidine-5'-phosphate decarboxylase
MNSREQLIVALDVSSATEARKLVSLLGGTVDIYKVGMQLYTAEGPAMVRDLIASGKRVFLDLKYHDIPSTVAAAVHEAAALAVSLLTVHASGGTQMLRAAVESARGSGTKILAVTVLTSMEEPELGEVGVDVPLIDQVVRLASLGLKAGCHGVVSSAREVKALRARLGDDFLAVTPGVRPVGASREDQARVVTPGEAIAAGASHVVVGRPITAAPDPVRAARDILSELDRHMSHPQLSSR